MGELTTQLSSWPGSLDTALALSDGPGGDSPKASHINGVIDAVLKLQADLGIGLKGSVADLKTRLAANISAVGGLLSGTVFPGSPTSLQLFWRTDTKQLHVYDDALGQWQRVDSTNVHSALGGLLADDHPQYAEIAASETISGAWNFTTAPSLPAGSIGSPEIADGSIVDADVSPSAGIADTKLATIATPGKVSDTALSSNIARLDLAQIFSQNQTMQGLFPQFIAETTGQTAKARIVKPDDRVFLSWNAYKDATGWHRDDTSLSSWLLGMGSGNGDLMSVFHSPAGTGLITFASVFGFDSAGTMTVGTVPLARINTVAGEVRFDGVILKGSGFTVNNPSSGIYDITFSSAFASAPMGMVSSAGTGDVWISGIPTTTSMQVRAISLTNSLQNEGFQFMAIIP